MANGMRTRGASEMYILLVDTVGIERKPVFSFRKTKGDYQAFAGEIFKQDSPKRHEENITLVSTENPDRSITCIKEKLRCLKPHEYNLLIAVVPKNERIRLLGNPHIFLVEKGDIVSVDVINRNVTTTKKGKVCYIGPIADKIGYYFGIEFQVRNSSFFSFYTPLHLPQLPF